MLTTGIVATLSLHVAPHTEARNTAVRSFVYCHYLLDNNSQNTKKYNLSIVIYCLLCQIEFYCREIKVKKLPAAKL